MIKEQPLAISGGGCGELATEALRLVAENASRQSDSRTEPAMTTLAIQF
jgi:hypothetical protein